MIFIRRTEVHPFTDKQIALLKTFASQAVIAIENVRLFRELQARNRELTETLEQQTATSDILAVINSASTELQPVFDTIAEHSVKLAVVFLVCLSVRRRVHPHGCSLQVLAGGPRAN